MTDTANRTAPGDASQEVRPFRIQVPQADLDDLTDRLARTRWANELPLDTNRPQTGPVPPGWEYGVPVSYVRDLVDHWRHHYDWRKWEARLNDHPQFTTTIDGQNIHFLHVRSPEPDATPLILTHGWPNTFLEYLDLVEPLTNPRAHGGDPADAFDVVVPDLPGFGFSGPTREPGWDAQRTARAWAELMARLGYDRYGASGSDWGTSVSTLLGERDRAHVVGVHLVPPLAPPDPATFDELTEAEREALAALEHAAEWDSGYSKQHSTRPQTIGYGLTDSPALLCAWIVEKLLAWSDEALTRDRLLDMVTLYWLTRTGASSARLYWESIRRVNEWISGSVTETVDVPVACTVFPKELQRPSRRWAERRFSDIRYWSEPSRGGHFAAYEQPELFVGEVRAAFRALTQ